MLEDTQTINDAEIGLDDDLGRKVAKKLKRKPPNKKFCVLCEQWKTGKVCFEKGTPEGTALEYIKQLFNL